MQPLRLLRNPIVWGASALVILTVAALVASYLYVSPPGEKTVVFYTDDAASVHSGDQVRIAGISVGEIEGLSLEDDRVRVRARLDDSAFVGDKSRIEVRMLTVVGGYYVNLISVGDTPLRDGVIPLERVTMPYSLIRTLNDATKVTDNLAAKPIRESLNEMQDGLRGTNVEAIKAVIDAGNTMMSVVDRQRGQITTILNLSDEYIERLSGFRQELRLIVEKIAIIQATLDLYSRGFALAQDGLGEVIQILKKVGEFYANHRTDFVEKVNNFLAKGRMWIDRNGVLVRGLRVIQRHIERVIDVQEAPAELLATDLCIPLPGSPC